LSLPGALATKQYQSRTDIEARLLRPIFTVGYGGRRFIDFVSLLKRHDIAFVADIRRFPKSTVPEYSRENLEARLPELGISYVSIADTLRGFRQGGYRKHTESDLYNTGID